MLFSSTSSATRSFHFYFFHSIWCWLQTFLLFRVYIFYANSRLCAVFACESWIKCFAIQFNLISSRRAKVNGQHCLYFLFIFFVSSRPKWNDCFGWMSAAAHTFCLCNSCEETMHIFVRCRLAGRLARCRNDSIEKAVTKIGTVEIHSTCTEFSGKFPFLLAGVFFLFWTSTVSFLSTILSSSSCSNQLAIGPEAKVEMNAMRFIKSSHSRQTNKHKKRRFFCSFTRQSTIVDVEFHFFFISARRGHFLSWHFFSLAGKHKLLQSI